MPAGTTPFEKAVSALQVCMQSQGKLVVFTGAGVSKESGIPTFRDVQTGLWANYNPEDLATREGFLKSPRMVWDWYDFRRNKVWDAQPNPGHLAIAALETRFPNFTLVTQNIDNLHQRAGSRNVLELHGNIFRYKCLDKNHPVSDAYLNQPPINSESTLPQASLSAQHSSTCITPVSSEGDEVATSEAEAEPPRCPMCASWVRPDVVWFGEMLPELVLNRAFDAAMAADVMLIAGTSGVVQPAASIPAAAKETGATVIEINPEMSALTPFIVDYFLQGSSGELLAALVAALTSESPLKPVSLEKIP